MIQPDDLRPYQKELVREVQAAFKTNRRVCMQAPTGSGKTCMSAYITLKALHKASAREDQRQILYLVHRKEIFQQTLNTLYKHVDKNMVGCISAGRPIAPWAPLQVGTIQTVGARLKKGQLDWLNPWMLVFDETHHIRASTWEAVVKAYEESWVLGLTATPARLDGKGLGAIYEELVVGPSIRTLIADGWMADLEMYSIPGVVDLKGIRKQGGDYAKGELSRRMKGPVIAKVADNWQRIASARRTLNYSASIADSMELVEVLNRRGFRAEHVDGKTHDREREAIFRRFHDGATQFISNVDVATEGLDVPDCDCVIARPTASLTMFLQMVGRGMRPKEDGRKCILLDIGGNLEHKNHGDPREPYRWSLSGGVEEETRRSRPNPNRVCHNCSFMYPRIQTECPACGVEPLKRRAQEVEFELTKVEVAKRGTLHDRRKVNELVKACGPDLSGLHKLAKEYGYKPGQAYVWMKIFQPYWDARGIR